MLSQEAAQAKGVIYMFKSGAYNNSGRNMIMIDQLTRLRIKITIGHNILRFMVILAFSPTTLFAQQSDEIIFKSGGLLKGQADRESLSKSQTSIRFLPKGMTSYQYYNIDQINFVRSWNGKML